MTNVTKEVVYSIPSGERISLSPSGEVVLTICEEDFPLHRDEVLDLMDMLISFCRDNNIHHALPEPQNP